MVLAKTAHVRGQRQLTCVDYSSLSLGRVIQRPTIDASVFYGHAQGYFTQHIDEKSSPAPHHVSAQLSAVKLIAGVKTVQCGRPEQGSCVERCKECVVFPHA